jgi:hypothetical protein
MDDEQHQHLRAMRQAYQRRLYKLEEQAAELGSYTPPHVSVEIDAVRNEIDRLDALLSLAPAPDQPRHVAPHAAASGAIRPGDIAPARSDRSRYQIRAKGDVAVEGSTIDKRSGGVFVQSARVRGNIQGRGAQHQDRPARDEPGEHGSDQTDIASAADNIEESEKGRQ